MARRLLVAAFMVALMASPALAKGGPGGGQSKTSDPSIVLNQSNPYLGESVTFTTVYPSTVKNVSVALSCYQSGGIVYVELGWPQDTFTLGGVASTWLTNGGPASCTAVLQTSDHQGETVLASQPFDVSG
jgi:hypothetical protein